MTGMKIGKSLRNTLSGAFTLIASATAAGEPIDTDRWDWEQRGDVDLAILPGQKDQKVNTFAVVCPYGTLGDLSGRSAATVFLYAATPESIREEIKNLDKKIPPEQQYRAETMPLPQVNIGIIGKDSNLATAYTYGQIKTAMNKAMETPGGFEGIPADNEVLRKKLAKHASEYCFSGF